MSEPYETKKAKIDTLVISFSNSGYKSNNKLGQDDILEYLTRRTSSGYFDPGLAEKLFQVLSLDNNSSISVEEFINGFLQFDEDLRKNADLLRAKLNQEQERYSNLVEQCKLYKSEKLNSEGMCENAKVYGEITDIDVKRKLEGIKEIIIKVIYNDKSEELHFKIGDCRINEMLNRGFEFKPKSRKDHFEFIMKGVNDRNQVFDIGSKVFSLVEVNSHEEYDVQIIVPEIDNEEQVAAYINARIVLYWSDYKYYERLKKKSERKLKKLIAAMNKATQYLNWIKEIYGDLTKQQSDLIVDFNNEKIMQKRPTRLKVDFNNTKEAETSGGNFLVEFNNKKEVKRNIEEVKVEYNNTKEVVVENKVIEEETVQESLPEKEVVVNEQQIITQVNEPIMYSNENENLNDNVPIEEPMPVPVVENEMVNQEINFPSQEVNEPYLEQVQTETNTNVVVENGGEQYDMGNVGDYANNGQAEMVTTTTTTTNEVVNDYSQGQQNNGYGMAETIGYGTTDNTGSVEAYGTGGLEVIDQTTTGQLPDVEDIIKDTEIRTSINRALVNETTKDTVFTTETLPVKVLEAKINEVIYDNKVNTLPMIYGGKRVTYETPAESNGYINNNYYQTVESNQEYNYTFGTQ